MEGWVREVGKGDWDREVVGSEVPVLVEFWGDWCAPCHKLNPILEEIAEEKQGDLKVLKLDTEANPDVKISHSVRAAPTLVLFADGWVPAEVPPGGRGRNGPGRCLRLPVAASPTCEKKEVPHP